MCWDFITIDSLSRTLNSWNVIILLRVAAKYRSTVLQTAPTGAVWRTVDQYLAPNLCLNPYNQFFNFYGSTEKVSWFFFHGKGVLILFPSEKIGRYEKKSVELEIVHTSSVFIQYVDMDKSVEMAALDFMFCDWSQLISDFWVWLTHSTLNIGKKSDTCTS